MRGLQKQSDQLIQDTALRPEPWTQVDHFAVTEEKWITLAESDLITRTPRSRRGCSDYHSDIPTIACSTLRDIPTITKAAGQALYGLLQGWRFCSSPRSRIWGTCVPHDRSTRPRSSGGEPLARAFSRGEPLASCFKGHHFGSLFCEPEKPGR